MLACCTWLVDQKVINFFKVHSRRINQTWNTSLNRIRLTKKERRNFFFFFSFQFFILVFNMIRMPQLLWLAIRITFDLIKLKWQWYSDNLLFCLHIPFSVSPSLKSFFTNRKEKKKTKREREEREEEKEEGEEEGGKRMGPSN